MKTKLAFIILSALALNAFGTMATAKPHSAAQLRDLPRTIGQAGTNAQVRVPAAPTAGAVYESYSLGRQSYPNPDRGPYPAPCGTACF
jgi:hypothetical protein